MEQAPVNRAGPGDAAVRTVAGKRTWKVAHREPGSGAAYEQCIETGERRFKGPGQPGAVGRVWLEGGEWSDTHQHGSK